MILISAHVCLMIIVVALVKLYLGSIFEESLIQQLLTHEVWYKNVTVLASMMLKLHSNIFSDLWQITLWSQIYHSVFMHSFNVSIYISEWTHWSTLICIACHRELIHSLMFITLWFFIILYLRVHDSMNVLSYNNTLAHLNDILGFVFWHLLFIPKALLALSHNALKICTFILQFKLSWSYLSHLTEVDFIISLVNLIIF